MAKKSGKSANDFMGFTFSSWLDKCDAKLAPECDGRVIVLGSKFKKKIHALVPELKPWQIIKIEEKKVAISKLASDRGPLWVMSLMEKEGGEEKYAGEGVSSSYGKARDLMGSLAPEIINAELKRVKFELHQLSVEEQKGLLVGLQMGAYKFKEDNKRVLPELCLTHDGKDLKNEIFAFAKTMGVAANFTRHLVNLPASDLNPKSYSELLQKVFQSGKMKLDIWDKSRLQKENMGLMLAVGSGSPHGPCLVHMKYRPVGAKNKKPIAIVGKGITFDSGGLDIKPSAGMRLMKKDMAGSATVAGLAWWIMQNELKVSCDFYLPLAENMVDGLSFRPGDIVKSRSGKTVEIHNTDAEGRLVLADALTVATEASEKPCMIINVATLTGAVRVALGKNVGGLFSNDNKLAEKALISAQKMSDHVWRLPLYQPYAEELKTPVADLVNASEGMGGGINAALFLEKFVGAIPWLHFDVYAWADRAKGACGEAGGNAQALQLLVDYISSLKS